MSELNEGTDTNKIATEDEVKTKTGSSGSTTANLCCTKSRAIELGADSNRLTSYDDNQLVKYSDIEPGYYSETLELFTPISFPAAGKYTSVDLTLNGWDSSKNKYELLGGVPSFIIEPGVTYHTADQDFNQLKYFADNNTGRFISNSPDSFIVHSNYNCMITNLYLLHNFYVKPTTLNISFDAQDPYEQGPHYISEDYDLQYLLALGFDADQAGLDMFPYEFTINYTNTSISYFDQTVISEFSNLQKTCKNLSITYNGVKVY